MPDDKIAEWYRTSDGNDYFRFSFERQADGNWRAYITEMPGYDSRDASPSVSHRLPDGARFFVCWSTSLRKLEDCKDVAAAWANMTSVYIRTGKTLNAQAAERN